MNVMSLDQVSKKFKDLEALKGVSFDMQPGIYGLIGPNGAGKSTLIRLISTLDKPTHGFIRYNDTNIWEQKKEYRSIIGLMPQNQKGYENYSGIAFLYYMANLKGIVKKEARTQIDVLVKQVSLEDSIQLKIKTYSGGMRQRLMFAQALLGDPKIVILDEPTAGLDPFERIRLRNYISEIAKNRIVLIATHVMQDIESIADHVILLNKGSVVYSGTGVQLLKSLHDKVVEKEIEVSELATYQNQFRVSRVYKYGGKCLIRYIDINSKGNVMPTFEDAYLYYMVDYETHR